MKLLETGRKVMPSFAFLSQAQREAVTSFLYGTTGETDGAAEADDVVGRSPYSSTGYNRFLDSENHPAVKPPWGTLNAIDLNTGEYRWKVPLGEWEDLRARGIEGTGTENYGGPVVTAGGLVFIAASRDEHIRAFDRGTGEELWKARLPAAGYATPAVYTVGDRQFIVIACGGGKIGTRSGESYIAFALPEE
jgi:quinoprotein glucose dehydrogenase